MSMMYNRKLAAGILVLCVIGTILLGGGHSLKAARERQAQLFRDGTGGDGNSIANDLHMRCEAGHNLITVARRYMDANAEEISELSEALSTLEGALTVREAYEANYAVTLAADHLYGALSSRELSESDRKLASGQFTEMTSRNQTISHDGYNEEARAFNDQLGRFPTSVIAAANGIQPLELFR